jgi:hypothetical protein
MKISEIEFSQNLILITPPPASLKESQYKLSFEGQDMSLL